jgi:hypothetical protein
MGQFDIFYIISSFFYNSDIYKPNKIQFWTDQEDINTSSTISSLTILDQQFAN